MAGRRGAAATTARIVALTDVDDRLAGAWRALADRALEPNPYVEPEAATGAARLLGPRGAAAALIAERGTEVVFALPVVRRRVLHHLPVPAVTTWLHPHWGYLGTPLVDADAPDAAFGAVWDLLRRTRIAPRAAFALLPADGAVRAVMDRGLAERGVRATVLDPVPRAVLARRHTDSYLDGRLSGAHRKQLRRQRRQLSAGLDAEVGIVDRAAPGADAAAAVEDFLRLERSGWKGRAGTAMACTPAHAQHFRQMCATQHRRGRLRLLSLGAAGAAGAADVAMACVVVTGGTAFHVKVAYDERYRQFSPGLQLELELIGDFHRDRGLRWIDSGSDGPDSVSARLYPDRRTVGTLLASVHGVHGRVASRCTPAVLATGRAVRPAVRRLAGRLRGPS